MNVPDEAKMRELGFRYMPLLCDQCKERMAKAETLMENGGSKWAIARALNICEPCMRRLQQRVRVDYNGK